LYIFISYSVNTTSNINDFHVIQYLYLRISFQSYAKLMDCISLSVVFFVPESEYRQIDRKKHNQNVIYLSFLINTWWCIHLYIYRWFSLLNKHISLYFPFFLLCDLEELDKSKIYRKNEIRKTTQSFFCFILKLTFSSITPLNMINIFHIWSYCY
jgi:hypothetical protein